MAKTVKWRERRIVAEVLKLKEKLGLFMASTTDDVRPPFELVSPEEAAIRERRQREIREMIAGIKEPDYR